MSKMSQKEAVYNAVTSVLSENNIVVDDSTNVYSVMTRELCAQVNRILFEGFRSDSIEIEGTHSDASLKGYISGLQSNYLRKDKRLNGGTKYSAKNPGSRLGSNDSQLKALRALLSTVSDPSDRTEIQSHIDTRVSELQAAKVKPVIDTTVLPAGLKSFVK